MTLRKTIDLNSDVGERPAALEDGSEELLMRLISSANIACGGHAGNAASIGAVIKLCLAHGVSIGAHPGFPNRAGFGRTVLDLPPHVLEDSLREQLENLVDVAARLGARVRHVKPHGALYNVAVKDNDIAAMIARSVAAVDRSLVLVGLAGSSMLDVWSDQGFAVIAEAFADRRYEPDGTLQPRNVTGALIIDPGEAAQRAVRIAQDGVVIAVDGTELAVDAQTICIHSDTQNAIAIAAEVCRCLQAVGIEVGSF